MSLTISTQVDINGTRYQLDLSKGLDISLPVEFEKERFKVFGAPPATAEPYRAGGFVAQVSKGAGCNCPVFQFSAHLHGTHTECVGHISSQPYIVQEVASPEVLQSALVISVTPRLGLESGESYIPELEVEDQVITRRALEDAVGGRTAQALVVRTLPNDGKVVRDYDREPSPFFSNEAMLYICELGVESLLVDTPSVDRMADEGKLSNHHIYWGVEQGSHEVLKPSKKTITEFVLVADAIKDGLYALSLNIGNILSDAAPSRPYLYELVPV
jgi:arylformamidase